MRVLVACEFSGVVREAFRRRGHAAWSCDLLPAEDRSPYHFTGDVRPHLTGGLYGVAWDLLVAHPPCTYLCNSGVRWLYTKGKGTIPDPVRWDALRKAAQFFEQFLRLNDIPKVAIENPIMHRHATELINARPDQIIQPWQFGHGEIKATCLWLRNLPPLQPTQIVEGRRGRVHFESPGPNRWKQRSRTLTGIADAMADQWGS